MISQDQSMCNQTCVVHYFHLTNGISDMYSYHLRYYFHCSLLSFHDYFNQHSVIHYFHFVIISINTVLFIQLSFNEWYKYQTFHTIFVRWIIRFELYQFVFVKTFCKIFFASSQNNNTCIFFSNVSSSLHRCRIITHVQ